MQTYILPILSIILGYITSILTSYFTQKGKNAADKEDIGNLTKIVEEIKQLYVIDSEKQKISYAGIYKEKIDIYRELLRITYKFKRSLSDLFTLQFVEENNEVKFLSVNEEWRDYNDYYMTNKPFLSQSVLNRIEQLSKEFNNLFYDLYEPHSFKRMIKDNFQSDKEAEKTIPRDFMISLSEKSSEAYKKFLMTDYFENIEKIIVLEIKKDLGIIFEQ